jgi:hypothetical protein
MCPWSCPHCLQRVVDSSSTDHGPKMLVGGSSGWRVFKCLCVHPEPCRPMPIPFSHWVFWRMVLVGCWCFQKLKIFFLSQRRVFIFHNISEGGWNYEYVSYPSLAILSLRVLTLQIFLLKIFPYFSALQFWSGLHGRNQGQSWVQMTWFPHAILSFQWGWFILALAHHWLWPYASTSSSQLTRLVFS